MSRNSFANTQLEDDSTSWLSKHGLVTGIIGSLILIISSGFHINELVKGTYVDDKYAKYGISIVLFILVILEIIGWLEYNKYKKTNNNKAQTKLYYYNLPIIIIIFIIIFVGSIGYSNTSQNNFIRWM